MNHGSRAIAVIAMDIIRSSDLTRAESNTSVHPASAYSTLCSVVAGAMNSIRVIWSTAIGQAVTFVTEKLDGIAIKMIEA